MGGVNDKTVGRYLYTLRKAGLLQYKNKKKSVEEEKEVLRIENKPVQKVVDAVRSGVHELSRESIHGRFNDSSVTRRHGVAVSVYSRSSPRL